MSMSVASMMEAFLLPLPQMSSTSQKFAPTSWSGNITYTRQLARDHRKQSLAEHVYINQERERNRSPQTLLSLIGVHASMMDSKCPTKTKKHFTLQMSLRFLHLSSVFSTCPNARAAQISMFSSSRIALDLCTAILPSMVSLPRLGLNRTLTENSRTRTSGWQTATSARRASVENKQLLAVLTSKCAGVCFHSQLKIGFKSLGRNVNRAPTPPPPPPPLPFQAVSTAMA